MSRVLVVLVLTVVLTGCAFVRVNVAPEQAPVEEQVVAGEGRAKVAVVDLSGVISLGHFGLDRFSKRPPLISRLKEELAAALADDAVVALVVRVNSPGGSVTASDILYHELEQFRQCKKVVACIMDRGFSGGYYAALAADRIYAHPTSVLGGVGVISFKVTLDELMRKWGVGIDAVQSGPLKDFWSPLRPSRPEEDALMQTVVDRLQERFLGLVRARRALSPQALEAVATGRIFIAEEGLEMGLVDRLGYLEDAIAGARELAGVGEARVIIYRRPGTFAESIYAGVPFSAEFSALERAASDLLSPSFRYQFLP